KKIGPNQAKSDQIGAKSDQIKPNKILEFTNAYAYYKQVTLCNPIPNKQKLLSEAQTAWKEIKNENEAVIREKIQSYLTTVSSTIRTQRNFIVNTNSNKASISMVVSSSSISSEATQRIFECEQAIKIISDQDIKDKLSLKIKADHVIIKVSEKRLGKLKHHTKAQAKLRAKKQKQLDNEARHHHHSAKVSLASVAKTDMKQHVDEHYCLASIKAAQVFVAVFASDTVVVSQDDKAKIGLGIPVVGCTFKTIQSINEPVTVEDHDFPKGSKIKLILSVYLLIDPNNSNTILHSGRLAIIIRPEDFMGTSLLTHMTDLLSLVNNQDFASVLLKENNVGPIWVFLVDRGPDKNPKHFKNIIEYCNLLQALDLDYLTVRMHAPYQSAYNPVERSMASLSEKLAGITLPIDEYGVLLDSQGNVVDEELAWHNFEFSGNRLCELWNRDDIYGKPVTVQYVNQISQPFDDIDDIVSPTWEWIEHHAQLCRYSLDLKKCKNHQCCHEYRAPDAALLLDQNDGFFPPVAKGKNGHYIDPIHAFQYFDKLKIPQYDSSCPSILKEMYQHLYCSKCVDETSLAVKLLNFRVAEDVVDHDLLEDEISNSCE
ncbi:8402_t:CDS:2, partial [Gigaspora margarita]